MDISTATVVGATIHDSQVVAAFNGLLTEAIKLLTLFVGTLIGVLVNKKLHAENSSWKQTLAFRLVCYAENKLADAGDQGKFQYVADQLQAKFGIDAKETEHLIEEAVVKLQAATKGGAINETK